MWRKNNTEIQLENDSQVAIIGGGPAGCFFALHLLRYSRQKGLRINVTLFEGRNFDQVGPQNCGKCAGILSDRLQENLRTFGLVIPAIVIQDSINSYVLHVADEAVEIFPPRPEYEIITVFRGRGPRLAPMERDVSFDEWLLKEVKQAGVVIENKVVKKLISGPHPMIETDNQKYSFDLIVLANGINNRRISIEGFNYQPPQTKVMAQDELDEVPRHPNSRQQVHIYFGHPQEVMFGAVVPKGSVTNISLLGNDLSSSTVKDFLTEIGGRQDYRQLCGCKSRISVSLAQNYYDNRFVAIGDAAATRLYKDGIGSAFVTANWAAHTAVYHGISRKSFKRNYAPQCRKIAFENYLGQFLFLIWAIIQRLPKCTQLLLQVLEFELTLPRSKRRYRTALWNMFTGDDSYHRILLSLINPKIFWLLLTMIRHSWAQRGPYKNEDTSSL